MVSELQAPAQDRSILLGCVLLGIIAIDAGEARQEAANDHG